MSQAPFERRWRAAIYLESRAVGIGGAEYCVAVLGSVLARHHDVEVIHHKQDLTRARLEETFAEDLSSVHFRRIEPVEPNPFYEVRNPWTRFRRVKAWWSDLSRDHDLFVVITHVAPPFCHARAGVLYSLFPIYELPADRAQRLSKRPWLQWIKSAYQRFEWRERMRSYPLAISISDYTRTWTRTRWHIDSRVVYPPASAAAARVAPTEPTRRDCILSIGRFTRSAHPKRQLEMMNAFVAMQSGRPSDWTYQCVGGLSASPDDVAYFDAVRTAGADCKTEIRCNLERSGLDDLLAHAKIFWHATGLDIDPEQYPESMEHYGIVTVEAMSAGCVPVVIARGGQRELVEHGVSGFLWNDLSELRDYTEQLMRDDALRMRMSRAAIERSKRFSRSAFIDGMMHGIRTVAPRIDARARGPAVARPAP